MSARATHDVVATVGEYKDRQTGETKKRYLKCGVCFTNEQGQQSIKLDGLPVSPDWSGFLSLYPKENNSSGNQQRPPAEPQRQQPPHHSEVDTGDGDDIPF